MYFTPECLGVFCGVLSDFCLTAASQEKQSNCALPVMTIHDIDDEEKHQRKGGELQGIWQCMQHLEERNAAYSQANIKSTPQMNSCIDFPLTSSTQLASWTKRRQSKETRREKSSGCGGSEQFSETGTGCTSTGQRRCKQGCMLLWLSQG